MWLIVLEAVGALALFLFLMWWTMFSGRSNGELLEPEPDQGPGLGAKALDEAAAQSSAAVAVADAKAPIAVDRGL